MSERKNVTFEEVLERDGRIVYKTKGVSMRPLLRENRDIVVIEKKGEERLSRFDVALYKRGEQYVLHRVINVREDGYDIRGDNTFSMEDIPEKNIIGVLREIKRNNKTIRMDEKSYNRYVRFWNTIYPLRAVCNKCRMGLRKIKRKILK